MADTVRIKLLDSVIHAGLVHRPDAELELAEHDAEVLVERGLAEPADKPKRGGRRASSSD